MLAANSPERTQAGLASELVLRLLQRGLREQAIGDIEAGADIAGKASIRFAARNARIQDPAILAVEPPHAELHAERFTRIESRSIGRQTGGEVVGVDAAGPAVAQLLFERSPREREPRQIEEVARPVRARPPDHDWRRVRRDTEVCFTFSQRGFDPAPPAPLNEERADQGGLHQEQRDRADDVPAIELPRAGLPEPDGRVRRQRRFIDAPTPDLPPVERRHVRHGFNRNPGRPRACQELPRHLPEASPQPLSRGDDAADDARSQVQVADPYTGTGAAWLTICATSFGNSTAPRSS